MAATSHNATPYSSSTHHSTPYPTVATVSSPMVSVASLSPNNGNGPVGLHGPPQPSLHPHEASPHTASAALSPNAHQFFGPHAAAAAAAAALSAAYRKQASAVSANISPASASLLEHSIKSMSSYANSSMLAPSAFAFQNAFPIRELSVAYPSLTPFGNPFFNPYASNSFQSLLATLSSSSHGKSKPMEDPKMPLHFPMLDTHGIVNGAFNEEKMSGKQVNCSNYPSDDSSNEPIEKHKSVKEIKVPNEDRPKKESVS